MTSARAQRGIYEPGGEYGGGLPAGLFAESICRRSPSTSDFSHHATGIEAAHAAADRAADDQGVPARQAELNRVKRELARYIRALGAGGRFQTNDFVRDLDGRGLMPDKRMVDGRAVGGLVNTLKAAGVITPSGMRHTGGNSDRNVNSSPRTVWRILAPAKLAQLDWEAA